MQITEQMIKEALSLPSQGRTSLQKYFPGLSQKKARAFAKILRDRKSNNTKVKEEEEVSVESRTVSNNYSPAVLSAWSPDGLVMDIDKYCEFYGLPRKDIKSYKLVTHTGTPFYNTVFYERAEEFEFLTDDYLENLVKKYVTNKNKALTKIVIKETSDITRAIYTDVHVGMDTDIEATAPSHDPWNFLVQKRRVINFAHEILHRGSKKSVLYVDELGDFADGQNRSTVRGGHELPQNMHNDEMFDNCVALKMLLADTLISGNHFSKIVFNNVVNNNHSGSFDYYINSAVKKFLELKYEGLVEVNNHRKFINHYFIGDHCIILCHGKDKKNLKFGFKPKLDNEGEKKITNYIMENNIQSPYIEFSKGDSHQMLLDYSTSDLFDYCNYPSFAPPSEWVHTNYQKGRSGFVIQVFNETNRNKELYPYTF